MKKRFSILLNIISVVMCICAFVIGVYAIRQAKLNVTGNIGFKAHNCNVVVTPYVTGYKADGTKQTEVKQTAVEIGKTSTDSVGIITLNELNFNDLNEDGNVVEIKFSIENKSTFDISFSVTIAPTLTKNNVEVSGVTISMQNSKGETISTDKKIKIDTGSTGLLLVVLTHNNLKSATEEELNNSTFAMGINFEKYEATVGESFLATNWKSLIFSGNGGNENGFCSYDKVTSLEFTNKIPTNAESKTIAVGANVLDEKRTLNTSLNDGVDDITAYAVPDGDKYKIVLYSYSHIIIPNKGESLSETMSGKFPVYLWEEADGSQFSDIAYLTQISFDNAFFSYVTNMANMFTNCTSLTGVDLSKFDTTNVINMQAMFSSCRSLVDVDVSKFNTANVTSMQAMFLDCNSLKAVDVSNFNTSKVTSMRGMFSLCRSLTSLDVSNFDTSKVTDMYSMFDNLGGIKSLDVSNFDTSKVTDMSSMFASCGSIVNLNLTNFNTLSVSTIDSMFSNCRNLITLNISNFNTSSVVSMSYMFSDCYNIANIYVSSNWNTKNVKYSTDMFRSCSKLPNYNSKVIDKTNAHYNSGGYLKKI